MISSIVLISFINACVVSSYIMENAFPRSPRLIEIKLVFNFGIKLSDIMTTPNSVLKDIHYVLSIFLIILYSMKMCIFRFSKFFLQFFNSYLTQHNTESCIIYAIKFSFSMVSNTLLLFLQLHSSKLM